MKIRFYPSPSPCFKPRPASPETLAPFFPSISAVATFFPNSGHHQILLLRASRRSSARRRRRPHGAPPPPCRLASPLMRDRVVGERSR